MMLCCPGLQIVINLREALSHPLQAHLACWTQPLHLFELDSLACTTETKT